MNDSQKIEELLHYSRMKQKEFAVKCGFESDIISSIKRDKCKISLKVATKILKAFPEVNKSWLLDSEGEMLNKPKEITSQNRITLSVSEFKQRGYAPYYSDLQVSAGQFDLATLEKSEEPESWIKYPNITVDAWFPVVGCSMEPKIYAGDMIGVVEMNRWDMIDPDKIYLLITNEDRMIKHIEMDEENPSILWAISPNYKRFKIFTDNIVRILQVVCISRLV